MSGEKHRRPSQTALRGNPDLDDEWSFALRDAEHATSRLAKLVTASRQQDPWREQVLHARHHRQLRKIRQQAEAAAW